MTQKQRTLEAIFPKQLSLVERSWVNKDGSETVSYRIRVYSQITKKFTFFSLQATNPAAAKREGITLFLTITGDIQRGISIGRDKKKLVTYIDSFIEHMTNKAKNGKITQRRVVVVRQLLRSLEKFNDHVKKPNIKNLPDLYEQQYESWRDKTLARLTGNTLTPRTRNNESSAHRQFLGFLKERGIVEKIPVVYQQKIHATNYPFPETHYRKLLNVMRNDISAARNPKTRWNWSNMRTLILLMANTGCRVTEARNLRWEDIKMVKGSPRIYFHGKNKEREITVSQRVHGHLMELKEFKSVFGQDWEWQAKEYPEVFSSWKMKKCPAHFDSTGRRNWYTAIGLDPKQYPLVCFRHRFISDALRNGTHALQIAWYTGTSVNMIQITYGKITPPDLFKQVFSNSPEEANQSRRTKWFDALLAQKSD